MLVCPGQRFRMLSRIQVDRVIEPVCQTGFIDDREMCGVRESDHKHVDRHGMYLRTPPALFLARRAGGAETGTSLGPFFAIVRK